MALLILCLALLAGLAFVWTLFYYARVGVPAVDPRDHGMTFRHGPPLRGFAVLTLFGAEAGFAAWAILNPDLASGYAVPLALAAVGLGAAGVLLCWEAFRFGVAVSTYGLDCRSPWAARRYVKWPEIKHVEFSPGNAWYVLRFTDGGSFRVSALVPGVWRFLEECEKHLTADQMRQTRTGYMWAGRAWPYRERDFKLPPPPPRPRHWWWRSFLALAAVAFLLVALFVLNGLFLAARENAVVGQVPGATAAPPTADPSAVTVVAYNVAKGFAHRGGLRFADKREVEERLSKMAAVIKSRNPDLVVLSEALTDCGPCDVNQVAYLAKAVGLPYYAVGENYNVGLPFYRVAGGNAILARRKLKPEANPDLAGRQPFFVTHNNRRALFASLDIGDKRVWIGALHNDSFDAANNAAQMRQILATVGDFPCVLAGDFNATPDAEAVQLAKASGKFTGAFDGPPTFPEKNVRIDYVLGPADWTHVRTDVLAGDASDHRAVAATFRIPVERPPAE